jgi:hypothetical protein
MIELYGIVLFTVLFLLLMAVGYLSVRNYGVSVEDVFCMAGMAFVIALFWPLGVPLVLGVLIAKFIHR